MDDYQRFLLSKIAIMYYEDELTQNEIAQKLGMSRVQVLRRLQKAKELGIVKIIIDPGNRSYIDLADKIRLHFGMQEVVVVPTPAVEDNLLSAIGKTAAEYLVSNLQDNAVLGVSWGYTVREMARNLPDVNINNLTVGNIIGGLSQLGDRGSQEIAIQIAGALHGQTSLLNVPFHVDSTLIKETLLTDSNIQKAVEKIKGSDVIVLGIGSATQSDMIAAFIASGFSARSEVEKMVEKGAIGEVIGRYFNLQGEKIASEMYSRIIGLGLEDLRQVPRVIGVAGGENKVLPLIGAMRGKYINVLITDEKTAQNILRIVNEGGEDARSQV